MTKTQMLKILKKTGKEFENCFYQNDLIKILNVDKSFSQFDISTLSEGIIAVMRGYQFNTGLISVITNCDLAHCNATYDARKDFVEWYMNECHLGLEWL